MTIRAGADELRAALLALFTVAADVPAEICAQVLDSASQVAGETDPVAVGADAASATRVRLGAIATLNSMCGACRACARGRGGYMPGLTARPPAPRAV